MPKPYRSGADNIVCSFCGSCAADEFHCPDCGFEFSEGSEYSSFEELDAAIYSPTFDLASAMIELAPEMEARAFFNWRNEVSAILTGVTRAAETSYLGIDDMVEREFNFPRLPMVLQ